MVCTVSFAHKLLFKLHMVKVVLVKPSDNAPPHYLLVLRLAYSKYVLYVGLVQSMEMLA